MKAPAGPAVGEVDAIVVGAGFAGLYLVHKLTGDGLSVAAFEAGEGVGGTWYWNRYPGARCDIESLEYSYSFDESLQQEWQWSEKYAAQPEILAYLEHVADRFDLRRHFRFDTAVTGADYDEATSTWTARTDRGEVVRARFLIMATGALSAANVPAIPGLDEFDGLALHTARWPEGGADLDGKRVAVIGTGSSGIQAIPILARQAGSLHVLQRTATYAVPARIGPTDPLLEFQVKRDYAGYREQNRQMWPAFGARLQLTSDAALAVTPDERDKVYETAWEVGGFALMLSFTDLITDLDANETAAAFVRQKIQSIVRDPEVAAALSPQQPIGCKRICLEDDYFETFNRPNVHLVDVAADPIMEITSSGIRTASDHIEVDAIVFATGFDAMTGALTRVDIRGTDGLLRDRWADEGPVNYLGLTVPGFPNMFTVCGPGSPSVLANVVVAIEQHVEWIAACIAWMRQTGHTAIEARPANAADWVRRVNRTADEFIYPSCNSWYLGANIPGKPRIFMPMPGFPAYVTTCQQVADEGYRTFDLTRPAR